MAFLFSSEKKRPGKTRKLPFLPRIGIYVELGGRTYTYKHAPILEALMNLTQKELTIENLLRVSKQQLEEIQFPKKEEDQDH